MPNRPPRFTRLTRRSWSAGALILSLSLQATLLQQLWSLQPQPDPVIERFFPAPAEWQWQFDPPPLPPPTVQPIAPTTVAALPKPSQTVRKRPPKLAPTTAATPHDDSAGAPLRAADLLEQMRSAQAEDDWSLSSPPSDAGVSGMESVTKLNLTVQAERSSANRVVEAVAQVLGGPTRAVADKVGDIHNSLLAERWSDQHHGALFRGCGHRDSAESVASFIARCPPVARGR